ncbi:hypothetical protein HYX06_05875, partial [Candidatus Woesearchaeota archaeon]|nr:hypothetical protein [Candidatus Woesearchaeota archaeon]
DRINRDDKCGANANYGKIISRNGRLSDGVSTYWGDCNEDAKVVMRKGFGDNEYVNDDNCGNCLLQLSKGVYKPKGDLLCGYDGNWYLCNSAYHGGTDKFFNSGNSRYKCTPNNEWQLVGSSTPTSTPTPSTCGNNNQRENNEDCDGTNLNNKRCQDIDSAFTGGTLTCYPNTAGSNACKFDTSRCTSTQSQPPTTQARRECGTSSPIGSCDASPGPIQYESEVRAAINNVRSANPGGLMSKRNDDLNAINDYINRVISQLESRGFEARKVKNCNDKESADAIIVRRRTGTSGSGSVVAADSITGQVAGITGLTTHPGRVRGVVWIDSDQDGIKDGNEQWKSEVDVRLEDERNNNALFRNMMNTNNNGAYQYDNLPVRGGYRLKILIPQGYEKVNTRPSPCPSQAICSGGDDSIGFSIDSAGQEREYNLAIKSSSGTTPTPPPTTNNQGPEYYGIIINIWSGRTLGDTANIGYIEKASWNRALPQNHVYGSNIIYYCREDGTFTINLDAPGITKQGSPGAVDRNKNLCEGIGSPWLGTRCCGEPGVCEYHNEAGKDKACWTATPTRQNIDLFENNAVILYGGNFHGCAIDKTNFFPNNNVLLKLFDKGTNNELITNHDYCFNIDQRNYYCSFNETWVPTEGRDKTRLSYAPPQDNSQSTNQITGRVTAINPITGQVAGITGLTTHPGKVKGVVYVDSNQNGVKDSNEQGKSEVDVKIEDTTNNRALFGPTNTPNSGAYEFNNVPVRGNYRIVFEVPQGYRVVSPKPSSCNSEDGCSNLGAAGTSFSIDRAGQERVYNLAIVQSSTTTTTTTTNNAQREMAAECCAATECWNGTSCIASQRNNPTAQPLRNHRCIDGEWKRAVLKCAPAGEPCGFCSDESMCMLNPLSNNPETQCVSNEYYSADNYCDNGIWSTRTKILALKLLAMRSSNDDFTLFCDTKENTLNNLVYVTDSGELASSIITSLNANNFCILKAGNKVIVGTSINSDISQIRGGFNIFGVTSCSNARDDNRYYACDASNKVWYNKKLKSIIYSTSQISVPSAQESSSSLSDSIRNIINRIKALINPPPFDESYVNSIKRFDKLYLAKKDSRTIRGALDGTDFKNAVVEYGNFRTNICSYTDSFNRAGRQSLSGISCRKEGDNYYVLVQGSQFASLNPEQIWPDLTAKLRLT